jgi:hypothetical protein
LLSYIVKEICMRRYVELSSRINFRLANENLVT